MSDKIEVPEPLSATNKGSFAYKTIKDRLPVTITKTIDFMSRFRTEIIQKYGDESAEDVKLVIESLSGLRYELQTDKPYTFFSDNGDDVELWNQSLRQIHLSIGQENSTWFKGPWLFSECYLYRRIRESMLACKTDLKHHDPFEKAKLETCESGKKSVSGLIRALCPLEKLETQEQMWKNFHSIMQAQLWSNKNDLSLSSGNDVSNKCQNLIDLLETFEDNILCNHIEDLWKFFNELKSNKSNEPIRIDIILDNCGIELAADLILCDFLLRYEFVDKIILHAKAFSWFISDVTRHDYDLLIRQFQSENSIYTNNFQQRLIKYQKEKKLVVDHENKFWTLSHSFDQMKAIAPDLYSDLQKSCLVILKGDLNYRKLIGDLNWPYDTSLDIAVREFKPTNLCAVRTLKADLVANLDMDESRNEKYRKLKEKHPTGNEWMNTGDYGVIQLLLI